MCCVLMLFFFFFFCKQKTAYEMRISDCSSDVCSSDLEALQQLMLDTLVAAVSGDAKGREAVIGAVAQTLTGAADDPAFVAEAVLLPSEAFKIGRASCRERVCQDV